MKNNQDLMRGCISIFFAFVLFFCMVSTFIFLETKVSVCNTGSLKSSLERSQYTANAFQEVSGRLKQVSSDNGMPEDVLSSVLSEKQFRQDLEENIEIALQGKNRVADSLTFERAAAAKVRGHLSSKEVGENRTVNTSIKEIAKQSASYYQAYASFPMGSYFYQYKEMISEIFMIAVPISVVGFILLIVLLLVLNRGTYNGYFYLCASTVAAAVSNAILAVVLYVGRDFGLEESPAYYKNFIEDFIGKGFAAALIVSTIGLMISIVIFYFAGRANARNKVGV